MKKKVNKLDKFRKKIVGLIISWEDTFPMSKNGVVTLGKVSHRNPIDRINAHLLTKGNGEKIFYKMSFKWLITMTGIFQYPNGTEQRETRELRAVCNIKDINEASELEYKEIRKHGSDDAYKTTIFQVECLGLS
jgi:hypothetical protein